MSCHTENGYRSMKRLLGERDQDAIKGFLSVLRSTDKEKNPYLGIMPPLAASDEELNDLAAYLRTINETKISAAGAN